MDLVNKNAVLYYWFIHFNKTSMVLKYKMLIIGETGYMLYGNCYFWKISVNLKFLK